MCSIYMDQLAVQRNECTVLSMTKGPFCFSQPSSEFVMRSRRPGNGTELVISNRASHIYNPSMANSKLQATFRTSTWMDGEWSHLREAGPYLRCGQVGGRRSLCVCVRVCVVNCYVPE